MYFPFKCLQWTQAACNSASPISQAYEGECAGILMANTIFYFSPPQNVPLNSLSSDPPAPYLRQPNVPMERSAAVESATPGEGNPQLSECAHPHYTLTQSVDNATLKWGKSHTEHWSFIKYPLSTLLKCGLWIMLPQERGLFQLIYRVNPFYNALPKHSAC